MWFSQEDGSGIYDFELEPGGIQDWEDNDQTDELRRIIQYLVHENNSLIVKLRGLSTLREVLQNLHGKREQERTSFSESSSTLGAENSREPRAGAGAKPLSWQTHEDERLQGDTEQICFVNSDSPQDVYVHTDNSGKVSCF